MSPGLIRSRSTEPEPIPRVIVPSPSSVTVKPVLSTAMSPVIAASIMSSIFAVVAMVVSLLGLVSPETMMSAALMRSRSIDPAPSPKVIVPSPSSVTVTPVPSVPMSEVIAVSILESTRLSTAAVVAMVVSSSGQDSPLVMVSVPSSK